MGIGDWGWGLGIAPIPNPQSPIPNPQSPIPISMQLNLLIFLNLKELSFKIIIIKLNERKYSSIQNNFFR